MNTVHNRIENQEKSKVMVRTMMPMLWFLPDHCLI